MVFQIAIQVLVLPSMWKKSISSALAQDDKARVLPCPSLLSPQWQAFSCGHLAGATGAEVPWDQKEVAKAHT